MSIKQTYLVPVIYQVKSVQAIDADSYKDAVAFLLEHEKDLTIPNAAEPIEGTLQVEDESIFGKDVQKILESHSDKNINMFPINKDSKSRRTMFSGTITKL